MNKLVLVLSFISASLIAQESTFANEYFGAGVSYICFVNGINKPDLNFAIFAHATNARYDEKINGLLQLGY